MTININPLDTHLTWDSLIQQCEEAKAKLEQLSHQLERHWFKRYLLGKAAYARLQADIRQVSEAITVVAQATQVVQSIPYPESVQRLVAAIEQLATQEAALQIDLPRLPTASFMDMIVALLMSVVGIVRLASIDELITTPIGFVDGLLVAGTVILLKGSYQRIRIYLIQTRIEDKITLIEQMNRIRRTFLMALRAETAALRKTVDARTLQIATAIAIEVSLTS